ncbi:hypothetical protein [Ancylobacter sp. IITR112]|uniref:hypothetical protein n=1 Tax=Ancylobacter sp. IITR112 TaxID=3138073 RepID=UPI00352ABD48
MARIPVDPKNLDGLLKPLGAVIKGAVVPPPGIIGGGGKAAPPPTPVLAHWSAVTFDDKQLPEPDAKHRYVKVPLPLFQYTPDFEDIKQGSIGDCYLLSAINALIRLKDPNFFFNMMGCAGDHVYVQFHIENAGVVMPVIVGVQRTILKKIDGKKEVDLQGHRAIWPYFIEKAYAFFRAYYLQPLKHTNLIPVPDPAKPQPSMPPWPFPSVSAPALPANERRAVHYLEAIEGGNSGRAYQHLTGEKIEDVTAAIDFHGPKGWVRLDQRVYRSELLCCALDETRANPFGQPWDAVLDRLLAVLGRTVVGLTTSLAGPAAPVNEVALRAAIRKHIADTRKSNRSAIADLIGMLDTKKHLMREVRTTDIKPYLARIARNPIPLAASGMTDVDFGRLLQDFVATSFPGKRGTGEYADYHHALFKRVKDVCVPKTPKAAFASTRDVARIYDFFVTTYASEGKRKGLVPGHAYEISGTAKITILRGGNPVDICFVLLRNPWRDYVRSYVFKLNDSKSGDIVKSLSGKTVEQFNALSEDALTILQLQGQGFAEQAKKLEADASQSVRKSAQFPVELSDITKFFDQVQVGS